MAENEDDLVRCDACPVLCRIRPGKVGSCDRYANFDGALTRIDPLVVAARAERMVPFAEASADWDGALLSQAERFVTGIGAGTTFASGDTLAWRTGLTPSVASTTITISASPLIRRLRSGKRNPRGSVPGSSSLTTAPVSAIRRASSRCLRGYTRSGPQA